MKTLLTKLVAVFCLVGMALPAVACLHDNNPGAYNPEGGWISDSAHVDSTAYVGPNSWVCEYSRVSDNAVLRSGSTYGNAHVYENARLISARIGGVVQVYGNAKVIRARVVGRAHVYDRARVMNSASVSGNAKVYGSAKVTGVNTQVTGNAEVYGTAVVTGGAKIIGGKVNCGRWIGITVTNDQTGQCGKNGQGTNTETDVPGSALSNPISESNTQSE